MLLFAPSLMSLRGSLSRMRVILVVGLVLAVATTGCIDPLSLGVEAPRPKPLVVDGVVTNGPGPHTVRLSRAAAFEQSLEGQTRSVTDATVVVVDETASDSVRLEEGARSGTYRSPEGALVGTPGHAYRLHVTLDDGTRYRSTAQTMPPPVPIDSLFAEFDPTPSPGFAVQVNANEPEGAPGFYRWSTRGTFEAPVLPAPLDPPFFCWADDGPGASVPVLNDRLIDGGRIVGERVRVVKATGKTSLAYQVDVRQRTLTRAAFDFWSAIETQVEQTGSTFDPPPSPVPGNITNVSTPDAPALGFFRAVGETRETLCVRARDFPEAPFRRLDPSRNPCVGTEISFERPAFWQCSPRRN
jgi:hypothetical protein